MSAGNFQTLSNRSSNHQISPEWCFPVGMRKTSCINRGEEGKYLPNPISTLAHRMLIWNDQKKVKNVSCLCSGSTALGRGFPAAPCGPPPVSWGTLTEETGCHIQMLLETWNLHESICLWINFPYRVFYMEFCTSLKKWVYFMWLLYFYASPHPRHHLCTNS